MVMSPEEYCKRLSAYEDTFHHSKETGIILHRWAKRMTESKSYDYYIEKLQENNSMKNLYYSQFDLSLKYMRKTNKNNKPLLDNGFSPDVFLKNLCYSENFSDLSLWALFILIERVSFQFADEFGRKKRREEGLTYSLFDRIGISGDDYEEIPYDVQNYIPSESGIKYLDLQIERRETDTGGDCVVFIEHNFDNNNVVIPVVLQAKRYSEGVVSINQKPKDKEYQFITLRDGEYPSAYLLFYNPSTRSNCRVLPPLIKSTDDIDCESIPTTTNAFESSQTVGSFILRTLRTENKYRYESPEIAMKSIINNIDICDLDSIIVFSTLEGAGPRFQKAWDDHPTVKKLLGRGWSGSQPS